jgi:flagellar motor switch protein FliM
MKLKLKGKRFERIEWILAESQDVMKMLTENDFYQFFKSWNSQWDSRINAEEIETNQNFDKSLGKRLLETFW